MVEIGAEDLRVDVFRWGLSRSAVRMIHLPTGISVTSDSEPSEDRNRARCLAVLRSKLWLLEEEAS